MKWTSWLKIALLAYAGIGIGIYYLQDYILFHPEPLTRTTPYRFEQPFQELNIPFDKETNLNIIRFMPAADSSTKARGAVLYFHGNKKNIHHYARFVKDFTDRGYEVWMPDYPGFGKSTGSFSEEKVNGFAEQVYKLARQKFGTDSIVIYGKSMGTGIAAQLASRSVCSKLILETPYYSIRSLFKRYLPIYPVDRMIKVEFPTYSYLPKVHAPIIIFQGTDDGVVPFSNAEKLKPLLKPTDRFVVVEGGSHNDLASYPVYQETLTEILIPPTL
ncbi:MAG TPA: alpha/beta fold hydrolase [Flavihumibacter sp.]|jgi:pimeloyl-ACP methyl ester carboxylesterase